MTDSSTSPIMYDAKDHFIDETFFPNISKDSRLKLDIATLVSRYRTKGSESAATIGLLSKFHPLEKQILLWWASSLVRREKATSCSIERYCPKPQQETSDVQDRLWSLECRVRFGATVISDWLTIRTAHWI